MIDYIALLKLLDQPHFLSLAKLAGLLGVSKTAVWDACQKLCDQGLAKRKPNGKYRPKNFGQYRHENLERQRERLSQLLPPLNGTLNDDLKSELSH